MRRRQLLALIAALAAPPALAHDTTGGRAMGTVESVSPERVVVRTSDGHEVTYAITPETRVTRDGRPVRRDELKAGQRAVVHGKRTPGGLHADEIKLPSNAAGGGAPRQLAAEPTAG